MTTEIFQWATVILLAIIWITLVASIVSFRMLIIDEVYNGLGNKINWLGLQLDEAERTRVVISGNVGSIEERLRERLKTSREAERESEDFYRPKA